RRQARQQWRRRPTVLRLIPICSAGDNRTAGGEMLVVRGLTAIPEERTSRLAYQQQGNAKTLLQSVNRLVRTASCAVGVALLGATLAAAGAANASDFSEPWKRKDRALVIDAYEYNPIDWQKLAGDK